MPIIQKPLNTSTFLDILIRHCDVEFIIWCSYIHYLVW